MSRTVRITNSNLNRYGFRVLTSGINLDQFKKNPILLFMHNRPWRGTEDEILPIGTVDNIRLQGDEILGDLNFDLDDPFAAKIAKKWDKGILKMVSPGLDPLEFSTDPDLMLPGQTRATVSKSILDEISVVDRGGNDDAIALYNSKTKEFITLKEGADLDFIPLINTVENQNQFESMKKIALVLNLGENATEEQIVAAIQAQQSEHQTLQVTLKAESEKAITLAIDNAIRDKRIKEDEKAHFVELGGKVGIEMLSKTLNKIEPAVKPNDFINSGGRKPVTLTDKKWADLTSEERVQLRNEDKPNYIKLFKLEYGYEPTID